MSDCCYVHVTCRRQDMERFEALGFHLEFESTSQSVIVELADEEANYAHTGELPTDIPYTAWNGKGSEYGDYKMACDGEEFVEVPASQDGFVVDWDYKTEQPTPQSLDIIRQYLAVHKRAAKFLQEPHHHEFSIENRLCIHCGVHADAVETLTT